MASSGSVGIVGATAACGGIVIDHGVHRSGGNAEEEPRTAEFAEITQVVLPVGLGHDSHTIAPDFKKCASYYGRTERWMVNIRIAREENNVDALAVVPAVKSSLLDRRGEPAAHVRKRVYLTVRTLRRVFRILIMGNFMLLHSVFARSASILSISSRRRAASMNSMRLAASTISERMRCTERRNSAGVI